VNRRGGGGGGGRGRRGNGRGRGFGGGGFRRNNNRAAPYGSVRLCHWRRSILSNSVVYCTIGRFICVDGFDLSLLLSSGESSALQFVTFVIVFGGRRFALACSRYILRCYCICNDNHTLVPIVLDFHLQSCVIFGCGVFGATLFWRAAKSGVSLSSSTAHVCRLFIVVDALV
jgi:hypothetical protein